MEIEDSDIDEEAKSNIIELLNNAYENLRDEAKEQSNELDDTIKEVNDVKEEVLDSEDDTKQSIDKLSNTNILGKIGINVFDKARERATESLQELQTIKDESAEQIKEILNISADFQDL